MCGTGQGHCHAGLGVPGAVGSAQCHGPVCSMVCSDQTDRISCMRQSDAVAQGEALLREMKQMHGEAFRFSKMYEGTSLAFGIVYVDSSTFQNRLGANTKYNSNARVSIGGYIYVVVYTEYTPCTCSADKKYERAREVSLLKSLLPRPVAFRCRCVSMLTTFRT